MGYKQVKVCGKKFTLSDDFYLFSVDPELEERISQTLKALKEEEAARADSPKKQKRAFPFFRRRNDNR